MTLITKELLKDITKDCKTKKEPGGESGQEWEQMDSPE